MKNTILIFLLVSITLLAVQARSNILDFDFNFLRASDSDSNSIGGIINDIFGDDSVEVLLVFQTCIFVQFRFCNFEKDFVMYFFFIFTSKRNKV